jgi:hypothetical protein
MKGKRHGTEDKIRILRQADAGQSIVEVCSEHNLSQVSFHRWKKQFWTLTEARVVIEDYRTEYNTFRPHSKLGYLSPERFAARKSAPSPFPVGLRPSYAGDGQPNNNPLETKIPLKD